MRTTTDRTALLSLTLAAGLVLSSAIGGGVFFPIDRSGAQVVGESQEVSEKPGPEYPRPEFDDDELAADYARGIELLEAREYDDAKSHFGQLRRRAKGEAKKAIERCLEEAKGGLEADEIGERIGRGKYRKALEQAEDAIEDYPDLVVTRDLEALAEECRERLFTDIETFEERENSDGGGGRGAIGRRFGLGGGVGRTGFGLRTKIVEQDPKLTTRRERAMAPVREGNKALEWRTGSDVSTLTFAGVEVNPATDRALLISIRCADAKEAPSLLVILDVDESDIPTRSFGDPRRQPGALLRARDGFHATIKPKVLWQDLRLELKRFKRKGKGVEWNDVSALRIGHLKGTAGTIFIDNIRIERSDGAIRGAEDVATADVELHPLMVALDQEDAETLSKTPLDEIPETIARWTPSVRLKPGVLKERLTAEDGRKTTYRVRVPSRSAKRYGVIVMLHDYSQGALELLEGPYGAFADQGGYLIVGPEAKKLAPGKGNPDLPPSILGSPTQHWWSYRGDGFVAALLDHLGDRFPIDRDRIVLSGRGMGASGTWNLGMRFPDRFSGIVPIAGVLSMGDYQSDGLSPPYTHLIDNLRSVPSFCIHNTENMFVPVRFSRLLTEELEAREFDHTYEEVEGRNLGLGGGTPVMQKVARWLSNKKRAADPEFVEHVVIDDQHPRQYWLRVDAREDVDAKAVIRGRIVEKHRIEIETENVAAFTVFLPDSVGDELTVVHGDKTLHEGPVERSAEALIESWRERRDPGLLYSRMIRHGGDPSRSD